ncbi:MAG: Rieske 2Fe-2S domain-containing protein [Betaproteobacteria bacterium]|nr:(2Fe-2S)-binding protein [Betaproteobacteria bacterium]NBT66358.1 (2Fe-2S)-binding protein [Betaproteobacteria bacterium]
MLSREDNNRLTQVGPDTPLGRMMRRYWHPIATSAELPKPDCKPMRAKLLGQTFVAFRDTSGKVGVMDELCTHRGASMALGRVEDGGIRCIYHGWKFSVDGTILDMPNNADSTFKDRLKAPAYPVVEVSGLIWTYIGDANKKPPFRRFAYDEVPDSNRILFRVNTSANFFQMWEGGTDSSHVGILHSNLTRPGWLKENHGETALEVNDMVSDAWDDMSPQLDIENTAFGFHYASIRKIGGPQARNNVRLVPLFEPYGRVIQFPDFFTTVYDVPMDDENTATYLIDASFSRKLDLQERLKRSGMTEERFYKDNTFVANWDNSYWQDRDAMEKRKNWSGFKGITQEDAVISTSMGPIYDRTQEHLVAADAAVVRLRKRLMDSINLNEKGEDPIGLHLQDMTNVIGFDVDMPDGKIWREYAHQQGLHKGEK